MIVFRFAEIVTASPTTFSASYRSGRGLCLCWCDRSCSLRRGRFSHSHHETARGDLGHYILVVVVARRISMVIPASMQSKLSSKPQRLFYEHPFRLVSLFTPAFRGSALG